MGCSAGHGAILVAPAPKIWIAADMAREASVLREGRKAQEELNLAWEPQPKGKAKANGIA